MEPEVMWLPSDRFDAELQRIDPGSDSTLLAGQIGTYLATAGGRGFANDLYVIWIGANDSLQGLNARSQPAKLRMGSFRFGKRSPKICYRFNLPNISLIP